MNLKSAHPLSSVSKFSYFFLAFICISIMALKLTTLLLVVLFSVLILRTFHFGSYKMVSILFLLCVVCAILFGFGYFVNSAVTAIPDILERSLPAILNLAKSYGFELPFSDLNSLKTTSVQFLTGELDFFANFAKVASKEFLYLIIGIAISIGIFLTPSLEIIAPHAPIKPNLYSDACRAISMRFHYLFLSFRRVMGAQLIISMINTFFTALFLFAEHLPNAKLLLATTFLCGLLPIVGNLISNTVIFCVAATVSPSLAIYALIFLIVLHKAEYFLNSKIIGSTIKNPMWLTLVSLVVGERLMGIAGMILAPIFLNYIKLEASRIAVDKTS